MIASASVKYHVIMASRTPSKGAAAANSLRRTPGIIGTISTVQLDVTDDSSIAAAVAYISQSHGRLDALVNNAAVYVQPTVSLRTQLEETFEANVVGAALVSEAFTPLLLKSHRPYLLHVSSGLGSITLAADMTRFDSSIDARSYRMSKAALNMLMMQDAKTLGPKGVKVFAVCPGLVESNLRGTSQEARTVGGKAGDPKVSGRTMLRILEGARDAEAGLFVHKDGVYPW